MTSKKRPTTAFLLQAAPASPVTPQTVASSTKIPRLFQEAPRTPERSYFPLSTPALLGTLTELFLKVYAPKIGNAPVVPPISQTAGTKYMSAGITFGWQESSALRESAEHFLADIEPCAAEGLEITLSDKEAAISFSHPYMMIETLMRMMAAYPHIVEKGSINTLDQTCGDDEYAGPISQARNHNHILLRNHAVTVFSTPGSLPVSLTELAPSGPQISPEECCAASYRVMKRSLEQGIYVLDLDNLMTLAALDCGAPQPYAHAAYH